MLAGSAPPGTAIVYPNILLADSAADAISDSDSLDLDCDNVFDAAIDLQAGATWVDMPHTLSFRISES